MASHVVVLPGVECSKIIKWKVKSKTKIGIGAILAIYQHVDSVKVLKLKCDQVGTVEEVFVAEGGLVKPGEALLRIQLCTHSIVMKDMCAECGADLRQEGGGRYTQDEQRTQTASVAMVHSIPELVVSEKRALELGRADEQRLLADRKLVLLVDLDQTLLHTTNDDVPVNLKDVHHFQLPHPGRPGPPPWYHTKFRPSTQRFLHAITSLYELHICSFGARMYAHTIAGLLDPTGSFFSHRILSRDECFHPNSKTANLKALFPCGDSLVCIIDDREDVWNFASNLVHVRPYFFFHGTADINAPRCLDKTDLPPEGDAGAKAPTRKSRIVRVPKRWASKRQHVDTAMCDKLETKPIDAAVVVLPSGEGQPVESGAVVGCNAKTSKCLDDMNEVADKSMGSEIVVSGPKTKESTISADAEKTAKPCESQDVAEDVDMVEVSDDAKTADILSTVTQKVDKMNDAGLLDAKVSNPANIGANSEPIVEVKPNVTEATIGTQAALTEPMQVDDTVPAESTDDSGSTQTDPIASEPSAIIEKETNKTEDKTEELTVTQEKGEDGSTAPVTVKRNHSDVDTDSEYEEQIEWEDDDDYLLYLEDILRRIHRAFYRVYDQQNRVVTDTVADMKSIVPYVRRKVLSGCHVVFSGVFPTNQPVEQSRAYRVAVSLGVCVQSEFVPRGGGGASECATATTHVVAARSGTSKVSAARNQRGGVHIVHVDWLWACADRWEWVEERLFPLARSTHPCNSPVQKRSPLATGDGDEKVRSSGESPDANRRFSDSYNPLYTLSGEDIASMDREVEQMCDSDDDDDDEDDEDDNEKKLRQRVLSGAKNDADSSSEESLGAEFPKGWKRTDGGARNETETQDTGSFDDDEDCDSIGSVDEEMAAAIEKEFLS